MKKHSRFLSLILRHKPEVGNITLDAEGWVSVKDVLGALNHHVSPITRTQLDQLVLENDKQRFAFNERRDKIRANQGHSVDIDLALEPQTPPDTLYHGTKQSFLGLILRDGICAMKRQHVHLSATIDTAINVAGRRGGDSVILTVDTSACPGPFYMSANGVWLTDTVPVAALSIHYEDE